MDRIDHLFKTKGSEILSVYMTAGYPERDSTVHIIQTLQSSGVDMIEIGMPFSDPLADGPVIQESSQVALENGMSIQLLFEQLNQIRDTVTIPLILMGYLNPVMQYGMEKFLERCRDIGIDGLIIPDLPMSEYRNHYSSMFEKYSISLVMLITPQTDDARIIEIAHTSKGFLYVVADSSTTGAKSGINRSQLAYFKRVRDLDIDIPRLIGFGISNAETFQMACKYSNGAIIGSAFIGKIGGMKGSDLQRSIQEFISSIRSQDLH